MTDPAPQDAAGPAAGSAAPAAGSAAPAAGSAAPAAAAGPAFEASHDAVKVIDTREDYLEAVAAIAAGHGPVAVDAERASGYRYSQRAYLIQVFRRGAGAFLFDPIPIGDFSELQAAIVDEEWLFHAASQDLPCLQEVGLVPTRIFDTELGARIAGFPRVGLGAVVEQLLGITLAKAHSAADWSTRPLPQSWLVYASLDVELLPDLRDALAERLDEAGKTRIAQEEFDAVLHRAPKPARAEPWRRLSGMHALRGARALAIARSLWLARDEYARQADIAPGRTIPDAAIVAAAAAAPESRAELGALKAFTGRASRSASPLVGRRRGRSHHRGPPPSARCRRGDAAPAPRLGGPQPGGRPPVQGRTCRGDEACRGARHPAREPAHTGDAPARVVGPAVAAVDRAGRSRPRRARRPSVAGRGTRVDHRVGLCRCRTAARSDERRRVVGTTQPACGRPGWGHSVGRVAGRGPARPERPAFRPDR